MSEAPLADLALHVVYRDPAFDAVMGVAAAATDDRMPLPVRPHRRVRVFARRGGPRGAAAGRVNGVGLR